MKNSTIIILYMGHPIHEKCINKWYFTFLAVWVISRFSIFHFGHFSCFATPSNAAANYYILQISNVSFSTFASLPFFQLLVSFIDEGVWNIWGFYWRSPLFCCCYLLLLWNWTHVNVSPKLTLSIIFLALRQ